MNPDKKLIVKTNLKRYRLKVTDYTQREVADKCGIPIRTYQSYEQGERPIQNANSGYIIAIARLFGLDIDCIGLLFG